MLPDDIQQHLYMGLSADENDEQLLEMHLEYGFADQRRPEKRAERNEEVAAHYTSHIEQRIRNGGTGQDAPEADLQPGK